MGGGPIDHSIQRLVEGGVGASLCELVRADLSEKFFQNIDHRKRVAIRRADGRLKRKPG